MTEEQKAKYREKQKQWKAANPEKVKANRERYNANHEDIKAYRRAYYLAHLEKIKKYYNDNSEKSKAYQKKYNKMHPEISRKIYHKKSIESLTKLYLNGEQRWCNFEVSISNGNNAVCLIDGKDIGPFKITCKKDGIYLWSK